MVINNKLIAVWRNIKLSYENAMRDISHETGLSVAAIDILLYLFTHGRTGTAKDINHILEMKPNLISSHVEKLHQHGYITREEVGDDRRKHILVCTEKAVPVCLKARQIQRGYFKRLTYGISGEDYEVLIKCFGIMNDNAIRMK